LNPENRMDVDFLYSLNNRDRGNDFAQDFFKVNGQVFDEPLIQSQLRDNKDELFSGRTDFEFVLMPGISAEAGARIDLTRIDNKLNSSFIDNSTGENIDDPNISNHFIYEQDVLATYFTAGGELGLWQYKLGLRAEQTFTSSELVTTGEDFQHDYFSLFPSLFLGYSLGEGEDLIFSYSRRINRPRTGQLNPFRDLSDPNNFRTGNPALKPEYTDAFEFSHVKIWDKITLNSTLYYRQTNDLIRRYISFEEEGITVVTFENLGRSHSFGFEAIANIRPLRWWNINATANIFGTRLDRSELTEGLNRSSEGYTLQMSSSKTVWNGTSIQLSSRYRSGFIVPQGEIKPFFNVDVALRRNFLDNNLTISLNARDIFNTLRFRFNTVDDIPIVRTMDRNWESRVFTINATYRFGSRLDGPQRRQRRDNDMDRFETPDF
jgi:outer membrane receptor protein involved in Fe transport